MKKWKRVSQDLNSSRQKSSDRSSRRSGSQKYSHSKNKVQPQKQSILQAIPSLNINRTQHNYIRKLGSLSSLNNNGNFHTLKTEIQSSFDVESFQTIACRQKGDRNFTDRDMYNYTLKVGSKQANRFDTQRLITEIQPTQTKNSGNSINLSRFSNSNHNKFFRKKNNNHTLKLRDLQISVQKLRDEYNNIKNATKNMENQVQFMISEAHQALRQHIKGQQIAIDQQCEKFFDKLQQLNKQKQALIRVLAQL